MMLLDNSYNLDIRYTIANGIGYNSSLLEVRNDRLDLHSDIIPSDDDQYALGSATNRFNRLYASNLIRSIKNVSLDSIIDDYMLVADASNNAIVLTLPSDPVIGEEHVVIKVDDTNNQVIINANNNQSIEGEQSYTLSVKYSKVKLAYIGLGVWVVR